MVLREAENTLKKLAQQFRAVALVGPRQCGKSTLAKAVFPDRPYVSLENPEVRQRALDDPKGFLHSFPHGAVVDEAHRVPELFNYLQQLLDETRERGLFILTGSNNFLMLEKITQSLAGRIGYLDLTPFSLRELFSIPKYPQTSNEVLWRGGYPAVTFEKVDPHLWFPSYVRTYVERDVRQIKNITDLTAFQRLLFLCAGRVGQQLNLSNVAIECGVDHKTVRSWMSVLQASYVIYLLPPFYQNFSKRVVKSPKLYFYDTGLVCYLLGIESPGALSSHAARGAIFENMIVTEVLKSRLNAALRSDLYFWRDASGHEIDLVMDRGQRLWAFEIKSGMTFQKDQIKGLRYWYKTTGHREGAVIYGGDESYSTPEARIIGWREAVNFMESL